MEDREQHSRAAQPARMVDAAAQARTVDDPSTRATGLGATTDIGHQTAEVGSTWGSTSPNQEETATPTWGTLIDQRLADVARVRERMKRDQEEIRSLKTETRAILARLYAG